LSNRMVEDKSIDIAAGKIFDWLLDRRHCSAKWERRVLPARQAAKEVEAEFADDSIFVELMRSFGFRQNKDDLDFVFCQELLRKFEEEDGSAGWTGIGASNRVKKWSSIVSSYQKENAHWAECATTLTRLLQKELISIERHLHKISQKQEDCLKRNEALLRSSVSCLTRYKEACSKLSIDSSMPIKPQILKDLDKMPENILAINKTIASLEEARNYYLEFATKTCQLEEVTPSLDALKLIGEKPAATVFEYQEGRAPSMVIRDVNCEVYQDFDIVEEEDVEFEIEMIEDFELEEEDIQIEDSNGVLVNQTPVVAKGKLAAYLIEDAEIRQSLMNDIAELDAFCNGRQRTFFRFSNN